MAIALSALLKIAQIALLTLSVVGIVVLSKKRNVPRNGKNVVLFIVAIILLDVLIMGLPLDRWLISYDTPEDAYYAETKRQPDLVLEGRESSFALAKDGAKIEIGFYKREMNGWKLTGLNDYDSQFFRGSSEYSILIYHVKDTEDYYVSITFLSLEKGETPTVSDSQGNTFSKLDLSSATTNTCEYYAYIKGFNESYRLTVDGVDVPLEPLGF